MKQMSSFDSSKIVDRMSRIAANRYLVAIRNGMSVLIPVTIIGSLFTILLNFPIQSWKNWIAPWTTKLMIPMQFTINFMALFVCFGIAYSLAKEYKIDELSSGVMAVLAFLITAITPATIDPTAAKKIHLAVSGTVLPITNFGAVGTFDAIIVSIFTVEIMRYFVKHNLVIKMPDGVPPAVARSFSALFPGFVIILIAWTIRVGLNFDINKFLQWIFSPIAMFSSDNVLSVIIPIIAITAIWLFGIHGMIVTTPLVPYWYINFNANANAVAHGLAAPHFMDEQFFQWFVWVGGAGATLSLAILMAFFGKSEFSKTMGRITLIPGIFNINEPMIFGIPIVMNPFLAIPFIAAPLAMGLITWLAMGVLHIVSYPIAIVPWTLPGPLGALAATGFDWRAAVLCVFNMFVAGLIYYPFFRILDNCYLKAEQAKKADNGQPSATVQNDAK